jgi:hypothetical protein
MFCLKDWWRERRVVASVAIGERPWFKSEVLPRLETFSERMQADLVVIEGDECIGVGEDFRTCAQALKVGMVVHVISPVPGIWHERVVPSRWGMMWKCVNTRCSQRKSVVR